MRKQVSILILVLCILSANCLGQNAWRDEWMKRDKFDHLLVSTGISMVSFTMYQDLHLKNPELTAFTTVIVLGGVKEFLIDDIDSCKDFATNCAGALIGLQLTKWLQGWENKKYFNKSTKNVYGRNNNRHTGA